MKKLMVTLGATATVFGAFAADAKLATSFEANDDGCGIAPCVFAPTAGWTLPSVAPEVVAYGEDAPYAYQGAGNTRRSDAFNDATDNANYLSLATGKEELTCDGVADSVFYDQVVKFTGFEDEQSFNVGDADCPQFAIWASSTEDEEGNVTSALWVGTAAIDGDGVATAKSIKIADDIDVDAWHRVTVKSLGAIAGERGGFLVYIDGRQVASEKGLVANLPSAFAALDGKLFPAMTATVSVASVGYQGIGAIDDLVADDTGPAFVAVVDMTVKLPANVVIASIKDTEGKDVDFDGNAFSVAPGAEVTITYAAADGFVLKGTATQVVTCSAAGEITAPDDLEAAAAVAKIGDVSYASLQEAFDVGGEVTLLADIEGTVRIDVNADKAVALDLNGKKITNTARAAALGVYGTLVISNGTVEAGNMAIAAFSGAQVTILGGSYTGVEAAVWLRENAQVTIEDGTFTATDNYVIGTLGGANLGKNTVVINGGTFNGLIKSAGYIACGIYVANDDVVQVNGGTFNIEGGCGICARAGVTTVNGGTFNVSGDVTGWVGDKKTVIPCATFVTDFTDPQYPGYDPETSGIFVPVKIEDEINAVKATKDFTGFLVGEGYESALGEDGYYTIVKSAPPIAKIGDKTFKTLADAFAAAQEGDTVTLLNDVALDSKLTITGFKGIFDLGGHSITNEAAYTGGAKFLIDTVESDLTISNGTVYVTGNMMYARTNSVITIASDATINSEAGGGTPNTLRLYGDGATLNVYGTINKVGVEGGAIDQCVGSSIINVYEGAKIKSNGYIFKVSVGAGNAPVVNVYGGELEFTSGYAGIYAYNNNSATINLLGGDFIVPKIDNNDGKVFSVQDDKQTVNGLGAGSAVRFSRKSNVADYCAEGYGPVKSGDWFVIGQPVAEIGGVGYASLDDAFAAVGEGETIKLVNDVTKTATSAVSGKNFTLDLNGKTVTYDTQSYNITLASCDLTITDSSEAKAGAIIKTQEATMITIDKNSKVTLDAGTIRCTATSYPSGSKGAAFKIEGEFVMNGGTIDDNGQTFQYALSVRNGGVATINGGTVIGDVDPSYATYAATGLTIPAASTAKFSEDYTAYCAEGYMTDDSQDGSAASYFVGTKIAITYDYGAGTAPETANKAAFAANAADRTFTLAQPTGAGDAEFDTWTASNAAITFAGDVMTIPANFAEAFTVTATYKAAPTPGIEPGKTVPLGNPGSMTEAEAQAAAEKLPIVLSADQEAAGLTVGVLCTKVALIGGAWQAYVDVKQEYAPAIDEESEDEKPIEVTDTEFKATIKNAVKGLYYGFKAVNALGADAEFEPVGVFQRAGDSAEMTLTAPKGGDACFYKLTASVTDLTPKAE